MEGHRHERSARERAGCDSLREAWLGMLGELHREV